jgi:hypothetical protein
VRTASFAHGWPMSGKALARASEASRGPM